MEWDYIKDLMKYSTNPLSENEFYLLFKLYNNKKNKYIRDKILFSNIKLLIKIVNKYKKNKIIDKGDLISEGIKGIYDAIEHYDINKHSYNDFKNILYTYISKYINLAIWKTHSSFNVDNQSYWDYKKIIKIINNNDEINVNSLIKKLQFNKNRIKKAICCRKERILLENVEKTYSSKIENIIFFNEIINSLNDKEKNIVNLRFRYDMTFETIGKLFSKHKQEICKQLHLILIKIKKELKENNEGYIY